MSDVCLSTPRLKLVKDIIKAYEEFSNGNNRKEDKPDTKSEE